MVEKVLVDQPAVLLDPEAARGMAWWPSRRLHRWKIPIPHDMTGPVTDAPTTSVLQYLRRLYERQGRFEGSTAA
jgi:hypothetical protein